jgi:hypothetical protein
VFISNILLTSECICSISAMGPSKRKRYRTISVKWAWQANGVGHAQKFRPCPGVAAVVDEGDVVFLDQDRTDPLAGPVSARPLVR